MTERDAFMRSIIESPGDDSPRLIYADWLEERGEAEHAEFIRLQIRLATYGGFATEKPLATKKTGAQRKGFRHMRAGVSTPSQRGLTDDA